jgi:predicted enzyme related to lactoylglutathione lyase
MSNAVVHFELPADDLDRAQGFYRDAFGWNLNAMPDMGYVMVSTTPTNEQGEPQRAGAINGGMLARHAPVSAPVVTIEVDSIDDTLSRVRELGGSVASERAAVGDMGFAAYFTDTEGNVVGLWENASRG